MVTQYCTKCNHLNIDHFTDKDGCAAVIDYDSDTNAYERCHCQAFSIAIPMSPYGLVEIAHRKFKIKCCPENIYPHRPKTFTYRYKVVEIVKNREVMLIVSTWEGCRKYVDTYIGWNHGT